MGQINFLKHTDYYGFFPEVYDLPKKKRVFVWWEKGKVSHLFGCICFALPVFIMHFLSLFVQGKENPLHRKWLGRVYQCADSHSHYAWQCNMDFDRFDKCQTYYNPRLAKFTSCEKCQISNQPFFIAPMLIIWYETSNQNNMMFIQIKLFV